MQEMQGIKWYLTTYIAAKLEIETAESVYTATDKVETWKPTVVIADIELTTTPFLEKLQEKDISFIAITANPIFQHAQKAIRYKAIELFTKPIPLPQLKTVLLSIPQPSSFLKEEQFTSREAKLYADLFLQTTEMIDNSVQPFFLIEPSRVEDNLRLYHWLMDTPIFDDITAVPLQKRIVCLGRNSTKQEIVRQARIFIQEWHMMSGEYVNIAIYDGSNATIRYMYDQTRIPLMKRFYLGYEHIFFANEEEQVLSLDPLLTPEQQQYWIQSLESHDIGSIKRFLYDLSQATAYSHDDVRIHLTSILAQIRRYMQKYRMQHIAKLEAQYRQLFQTILEEPILYTIIQEMILFTQLVMKQASVAKQTAQTDYTELVVDYIEKHYIDPQLSLKAVSKELGVSPNYLSHLFSKKQGISFKRYIQRIRIQQAEKSLRDTSFSISEIAHMNGFEDVNYFIKVFKQSNGYTPYRYRIKWRDNLQKINFL